ncbi:unnamed protein product [Amoebophrya sp. A120]|nr:unnamed protein product [Amoebophrya sp. A120]|eukprot:GSA120T00023109001.1
MATEKFQSIYYKFFSTTNCTHTASKSKGLCGVWEKKFHIDIVIAIVNYKKIKGRDLEEVHFRLITTATAR